MIPNLVDNIAIYGRIYTKKKYHSIVRFGPFAVSIWAGLFYQELCDANGG